MNGPGSRQRMIVALLVIGLAALGVYLTIDPGKYRTLAWVLLGFFAFRIALGRMRQKQSETRQQG